MKQRGFSMLEILIVLCLSAILALNLLPKINSITESAAKAKAVEIKENLKQTLSINSYLKLASDDNFEPPVGKESFEKILNSSDKLIITEIDASLIGDKAVALGACGEQDITSHTYSKFAQGADLKQVKLVKFSINNQANILYMYDPGNLNADFAHSLRMDTVHILSKDNNQTKVYLKAYTKCIKQTPISQV
jgi:prepilin-type N-terminal cleavage/methylation domain-containing protein